jgi:hypothetical protein
VKITGFKVTVTETGTIHNLYTDDCSLTDHGALATLWRKGSEQSLAAGPPSQPGRIRTGPLQQNYQII